MPGCAAGSAEAADPFFSQELWRSLRAEVQTENATFGAGCLLLFIGESFKEFGCSFDGDKLLGNIFWVSLRLVVHRENHRIDLLKGCCRSNNDSVPGSGAG